MHVIPRKEKPGKKREEGKWDWTRQKSRRRNVKRFEKSRARVRGTRKEKQLELSGRNKKNVKRKGSFVVADTSPYVCCNEEKWQFVTRGCLSRYIYDKPFSPSHIHAAAQVFNPLTKVADVAAPKLMTLEPLLSPLFLAHFFALSVPIFPIIFKFPSSFKHSDSFTTLTFQNHSSGLFIQILMTSPIEGCKKCKKRRIKFRENRSIRSFEPEKQSRFEFSFYFLSLHSHWVPKKFRYIP